MSSTVLGDRLSKCIDVYFEPTYVSATLRQVLKIAHDPERGATDLVAPVLGNQAIAQYILRVDFLQDRLAEWISESPEGSYSLRVILERTFLLLGKQASRNLIAGIEIHRIGGTLPKKDTDRMNVQPADQIRYALMAEDFCQGRGLAYSDRAFIGGLHFDLLVAVMRRNKGPRDALNLAPTLFSECLKTARVAYALGSRMGAFKHNDGLFAAALVQGLGFFLMTALYPKDLAAKSFAAFVAEGDKLKIWKGLHMQYRQNPRFEVEANELSSLYLSYLDLMAEAELALRYMNEPYTLTDIAPEYLKFAAVLQVARSSVDALPLKNAVPQALALLRLSESEVVEISKAALSS